MLASAVLKNFQNPIDSLRNSVRVRRLSPDENKTTTYQSTYEKHQTEKSVHAHRIAGRDCDHRDSRGHVAAGARPRQAQGAAHQLREQPQTSRLGFPRMGK